MSRYIVRRLLGAVLVMWAVATLVFFMMRIVPGDPVAAMLFDAGDAETVARLREKLGLDQSVCRAVPQVAVARSAGRFRRLDLRQPRPGRPDDRGGLPAHAVAHRAGFLHRADHRGPRRPDRRHAAQLRRRPCGDGGRLPRPVDARLLARHPADHHLRGQSPLAAGHRLCAAFAWLLAVALASHPAGRSPQAPPSPPSSRG